MEAATKPGAVRTEIVRRIYAERLIDRDPKRLLDEFASPDIEYVDPAEAVDPGTLGGAEWAVPCDAPVSRSPRTSTSTNSSTAGMPWSPPSPSGGRRGARARSSSDGRTWTLREGRIVRFEWGRDLEAALQAAGLREWGRQGSSRHSLALTKSPSGREQGQLAERRCST